MNTENVTWGVTDLAVLAVDDQPRNVPIPAGTIDFARWEIRHADGECCALSRCEAQLLAYLIQKAGAAVSRDEILARVWKMDPARTTTRTIDMHLAHLRRKLRDKPENPMLVTIRSKGYRFASCRG